MVVLDLRALFITELATGESISAPHAPLPVRDTVKTGERREFAGGRRVGISTPGLSTSFPFTLLKLTLDQVKTLESWAGHEVLVRDWRGQGFYGTYWKVTTVAERPPDRYSSTITLETLTIVEGV